VRKTLIIVAILVAFIVAAALWIFGGRQLSLAIDRFGTIQVSSFPIKQISYEGNGSGGILHFDELAVTLESSKNGVRRILDLCCLALSLDASKSGEPEVNIGTTKSNEVALSFAGKVFPFAPLRSGSENLTADVPTNDHAVMSIGRSAIAWPTPFDFNFLTGHSPTWRRHLYYKLDWQKENGANLELLWRYEDYFYSDNGWMGPSTAKLSAGLIRVEISNPVR
jgi:hypothetical protein